MSKMCNPCEEWFIIPPFNAEKMQKAHKAHVRRCDRLLKEFGSRRVRFVWRKSAFAK